MTFVAIVPGQHNRLAGVSMSIVKGGPAKPLVVRFAFGPAVTQEAEWTPGAKVGVWLGADADRGRVLLRAAPKGYVLQLQKKYDDGTVALNFTCRLFPGLRRETRRATPCRWRLETPARRPYGIVVDLPDWAGGIAAPEPYSSRGAPAGQPAARPARDVTEAVLGPLGPGANADRSVR